MRFKTAGPSATVGMTILLEVQISTLEQPLKLQTSDS
jgi:hypothetical protein